MFIWPNSRERSWADSAGTSSSISIRGKERKDALEEQETVDMVSELLALFRRPTIFANWWYTVWCLRFRFICKGNPKD
jgi:hypothetical protein